MDCILIVDDEATNLALFKEMLRNQYSLLFAKSGIEALERVKNEKIQLILLDIMMPDMDGYEVIRHLKSNEETQDIPVLIVSALSNEIDEIEGFKLGAVDYIYKPVRPPIVMERIKTQLTLHRIQDELQNQNRILEQKVKERTNDLVKTQIEIVKRLGFAAEYRDPETGEHIHRMSHYTAEMGRAHGMEENDVDLLLLASPMHDIGKIGTSDSILLKPGKLTEEEFTTMKDHTIIGGQILSNNDSQLLNIAQIIALTHHEKWNGSGYPKGLSGEEIPLWGRLASIADVFDALTSKRPYKEAWPIEKATDLIHDEAGQHFDPVLAKVFFSVLPALLLIKEEFPG
ncbi:MAG: response regulator [Proteobacteria bacterium]|nr:response regulator [Pseudomonadota bacterium]